MDYMSCLSSSFLLLLTLLLLYISLLPLWNYNKLPIKTNRPRYSTQNLVNSLSQWSSISFTGLNNGFYKVYIKGTSTDIQKTVFRKVLFMWSSMPISSFIGNTLTDLFRKPDNWRQIYKQTSSSFYTSNDVSRRKKYFYVIKRLRNSCLNYFL